MRSMMLWGAAGLALATTPPAAAQTGQALPQLGLDKAGACRNLSVYDAGKPGADKMVPIGCLDAASHAFNAGAAVVTPADASVARPLAARFGDVKVANDFGAAGSGAAIQAAIDAAATSRAGTVLVPAGDWTVTATLVLKTGVTLQMSPGARLKPGANVDIVSLHPGATCACNIDTSDFPGWNKVAIDVDGDNNALPVPYRLHTPTLVRGTLKGANGADAGTAIKLHADADDEASARILGVDADVRIAGFSRGFHIKRGGGDALGRFINGNRLSASMTYTWQALLMESDHINGYGIDGNALRVHHQPHPDTTLPSMVLRGQANSYDLLPWDWDTRVTAVPHAIIITAGSRNSHIVVWTSAAYISNLAADRKNKLIAYNSEGGEYWGDVSAIGSDGVVRTNALDLRFDNGRGISLLNSGGTPTRSVYADTTTTFLRSVSGTGVAIDANGADKTIALRVNGSNQAFIGTAGISPASSDDKNVGNSTARWNRVYTNFVVHRALTVSTLPDAGGLHGFTAFVSDGRKSGEGAGAGTGVLVYSDGVAWRRVSDDSTVVN